MRLKWPIVILLLVLSGSCREEVLPKPKAMLRLEYPNTTAGLLQTDNFEFELNALAEVKEQGDKSLTLEYPKMKGSIFITYKKVKGDLEKLLSDAQKLSYEHVVKADAIDPKEFINEQDRVYGMFYEVKGDAASQAQFYATDSLSHFVTGSLYFYAKPNYDSIFPAAVYLQKDIQRIMETLKWKN
jgi:gliding motility-associated lipoprotein GldD